MSSSADVFADPLVAAQVAHIQEIPARPAVYGEPRHVIHPEIAAKLAEQGIARLFAHQARSFDAALDGEDTVVVTGTNSGKTLCYNLPALHMCRAEPAVRCLYLFPTKALAQDQRRKLEALLPGPHVRVATYDGDTPKTQRSAIRKLSHIILTNPDMLHMAILPGQENWARFFRSLRLIVLDEMHVYRGVFGSNVGNILRRLLRLCAWHHSRPQIVACSATIGNPDQLFCTLTGRGATLIDEDGSPSGKRTFVFWNPPEVGGDLTVEGSGRRLSTNVASSEILASLVEAGQRTLVFSRARISAELVLRHARRRVKEGGRASAASIESYRAGYTPKERREIEDGLFQGRLLGLSSTNAMELGVDVGGLDAVVMNGYPGTASSFWQQAGRAGRGVRDGLAVLVAHDDPLEQFLIRRPEAVLGAFAETVGANPENPQILAQHLLCAAHERPMSPTELDRFGGSALEIAESLDRSGELEFRAGLFFYPAFEPPALRVNIRGSGGEQVRLRADGEEIGSMERWRAMTSAHAGAVYLHRGATYLVTALDLELGEATIIPYDADYYTQAITQSVLDPRFTIDTADLGDLTVTLAAMSVTDCVLGYRKKTLDGDTVLSTEPLELPAQTFDTLCVRFDLPPLDEGGNLAEQIGGIHGFEHALMAVAPLIAGCDRADLGSAWYSAFPDTLRPAVFVFDRAPGGVGLCERLFESAGEWRRAAHSLLASCTCDIGCPGCLYSARCECANEALSKPAALALFDACIV